MKIGIISDIHGYSEKFVKALSYFEHCDMILCAGDVLYHGPRNPILEGYNPQALVQEILKNEIPMLIARGNCDADVDIMVLNLPMITEYVVYEKDNMRFIVTHGHNLDEVKLKELAKIYKANIVITGHTHIRKCVADLGTLYINPGSISIPKGDGIPSIAIFENAEIKFINIESGEVIEKKSLI
jgi:putative phosphoesterase